MSSSGKVAALIADYEAEIKLLKRHNKDLRQKLHRATGKYVYPSLVDRKAIEAERTHAQ